MKTILITGAASGIGAAIAERFGRDGYQLVLTDRDAGKLSSVVSNLGLPSEDVLSACFDVADEEAWLTLQGDVEVRFGGLDVAVANAGVSVAGSVAETSLAEWRATMATNLDGVFLTVKTALSLIRKKRTGGSVIALSSASALKAQPNTAAYSTSKAAILQLVKVAALEAAADRIRVNAIVPAGVETPMWSSMEFFQALVSEHGSERAAFDVLAATGMPLKAYAKPEDIASMVAFLASDAAETMTGASLVVDGGYTL